MMLIALTPHLITWLVIMYMFMILPRQFVNANCYSQIRVEAGTTKLYVFRLSLPHFLWFLLIQLLFFQLFEESLKRLKETAEMSCDFCSKRLLFKVTFVQSNSCSKWHLFKVTFVQSDFCSKWHLFKVTFVQSDICSKWLLFKMTFVQNDICPKSHLFKMTFVQNDICSKWHLFKMTFVQNDICSKW
jgi:hypothetical protein